MKTVPPSIELKEEIEGLLGGSEPATEEEPPMAGFVGRVARYIRQVAIEAEATTRVGWRNGYEPKQVQTGPARWSSRCRSCAGPTRPFGRLW